MPNKIYRGPFEREPQSVNLPVSGAYLPGILVLASATALTMAGAADHEKQLRVLSNVAFDGQDIKTVYTSGNTGVAYVPKPTDIFQCRMAAGTYAKGDPLTVTANGRLTAATAGKVVFAHFDSANVTVVDDALADVEIANSFVKS